MTASAKAGRYELVEEIGHGSMGVVYRANDPVIGRAVAVKTMRLASAGTGLSHEELLARFQTEARAAGRLTHPNIVVVYDAGEQDGQLYMTMELIEGPSLQALIEAREAFPLPRVLRFMEQACSALGFAHQHNIVHRDIKPANLMLTQDDTLKITDFGTAKILQFGAMQTAQIIGTPSYMSPEQIKGRAVDGRSDIFSLGVVLYEMVTGQKPFSGDSVTTVIYKIVNDNPTPPRELNSSIHPGLAAVISKALAKPVENRFQSCHEFIEALHNYQQYRDPGTEATVAMPRPSGTSLPLVAAQPASAQPPRPATGTQGLQPVQIPQWALSEAAAAKRQKNPIWLVIFLLAVIGVAGYRVLPALREIWHRSEGDREAVMEMRPASLLERAPASKSAPLAKAANEKPSPSVNNAETRPAEPAKALSDRTEAAKQSAGAASTASNGSDAIAPSNASQPTPARPSRTQPSTAAAAWQQRILTMLVQSNIADQVQVTATGSAITLSGTLPLPQHRALLARLQNIPDRIQIIDDIEYADEPNADGGNSPAAPAASPDPTTLNRAPSH